MVDYSKFNRVVKELEEEEQQQQSSKVHVQTFDQPMSVHVPGKQTSLVTTTDKTKKNGGNIDYSKWDKMAAMEDDDDDNEDERVYFEDDAKRRMYAEQQRQLQMPHTKSQPTRSTKSSNEDATPPVHNALYSWSQTQDVVIISFKTSEQNLFAKSVTVTLIGSVLTISIKTKQLVRGALYGGVWGDGGVMPLGGAKEDDVFQRSMEWEIMDKPHVPGRNDDDALNHGRYVRVTLYKRCPVKGVITWWPRVFKEDSGIVENVIDLNTLTTRKTSADARKEAQRVWDEAHEVFRRNRMGDGHADVE